MIILCSAPYYAFFLLNGYSACCLTCLCRFLSLLGNYVLLLQLSLILSLAFLTLEGRQNIGVKRSRQTLYDVVRQVGFVGKPQDRVLLLDGNAAFCFAFIGLLLDCFDFSCSGAQLSDGPNL